jgi:hypothetical protein
MSTKATVAYGANFHLYQEVFDNHYIYLELYGVQYEASYNRVMIPIPLHIWEVIRQYSGIDLSFADYTDDQLRQYVENQVDEHIKRYEEADTNSKGLIRLAGSLVYGMVELPRNEQIQNGLAYYTHQREHQRQISQAIESLKQLNGQTR